MPSITLLVPFKIFPLLILFNVQILNMAQTNLGLYVTSGYENAPYTRLSVSELYLYLP